MNTMLNTGRQALAIITLLLLQTTAASAESLPWHLWKNSVDGKIQCAQFVPGRDWDKIDGTFSDGRCRTALIGSAGNAASESGRKNRMLELMTIIVAARPGR